MALLDRLRRRRDQPVPRVRVDRGPHRAGAVRPRRHGPAQGDQELHQGRGQGRAQGDVEDGHLHRRVVHAARRCSRPSASARSWSTSTSPAPSRASAASASTRSPRRSRAATASRTPTAPDERAHRDLELGGEYQWRREGEYHLFNPETVFKLQHATRAKRYDVYKEYTRAGRRPVDAAGDAARPVRVPRGRAPAGADRRGRAGQRDRQALRHRRDVVRLDLEGGARDARHRDEPHRRQVEHRRGRRGRRPLRPRRRTATCAARRSSRWRRAASASRRSTSSTPTTCRSRWRRAPSPARAASCRATRCTRGSPRPGTRRPASASSARRRTTTSTRSRTSSSSSTTSRTPTRRRAST